MQEFLIAMILIDARLKYQVPVPDTLPPAIINLLKSPSTPTSPTQPAQTISKSQPGQPSTVLPFQTNSQVSPVQPAITPQPINPLATKQPVQPVQPVQLAKPAIPQTTPNFPTPFQTNAQPQTAPITNPLATKQPTPTQPQVNPAFFQQTVNKNQPQQPSPLASKPVVQQPVQPAVQQFQFFTLQDVERYKTYFDPLATNGFSVGGQAALQFFTRTGINEGK